MAFNVRFLLSAEKDLEDVLNYYNYINENLSERFYSEFSDLIVLLKQNPFLEVKYNSIRIYKLRSFPYIVHFSVNELSKEVVIHAVVFGKQVKTNFFDRFLTL